MHNPFTLNDKTILVTGASAGIGKQIAISASEMGAKLILTGRSTEKLEATLGLLKGEGHKLVAADLNEENAINTLIDNCSGINGVVHSAGILKTLPFKFSNQAELQKIMRVNFEAPFVLTQQLLKNKKITAGSSIVFISSLSGAGTVASGISMYSASKGAINASVKVMALELAFQKIRVNSICPGMVMTEMNSENNTLTPEQLLEDEKRNYPLGYGRSEDVANAVIFLLSDGSKWMTGTNMIIDGGASIH